MAKKEVDPEIGKRAYAELRDNFPTFAKAMRAVGIEHRSIVSKWNDNGSPSAMMLKKMCEHGLDVIYILTGERSNG